MSSGFTGARVNQRDTKQKEFSTVNKDGKTVWEPGLPALVTSRRQHRSGKQQSTGQTGQEDVPAVSVDLRLILKMSAASKAEWLEKALKAMTAGKAKVQDVFNAVTHPKFASRVSEKYSKRMFQMVAESMDSFSDKQRLTLSRCNLAMGPGDKHDDSEDDANHSRRSRSSRSRRSVSISPPRSGRHKTRRADSPVRRGPEDEDEDIDKKQEEEKRSIELQKQKLKEQEEKRKAKLGAAFQFEPEEEAESAKKQLQNKLKKTNRKEELPSLALARSSPFGRDADPRFVEAMGGDKLLHEAHKILRNAAGSGRIQRQSRSRSRSRRRRERSRSPRQGGQPLVRSSGSYRSPTPDGRARGQARAARKAKMIASLMGIKR